MSEITRRLVKSDPDSVILAALRTKCSHGRARILGHCYVCGRDFFKSGVYDHCACEALIDVVGCFYMKVPCACAYPFAEDLRVLRPDFVDERGESLPLKAQMEIWERLLAELR